MRCDASSRLVVVEESKLVPAEAPTRGFCFRNGRSDGVCSTTKKGEGGEKRRSEVVEVKVKSGSG